MVRYQVLLCLDTYDTDAIAINKLCKLNFRYSTIYLHKSAAGSGFLKLQIWCTTKIKILTVYQLLTFIMAKA